RNADGSDGDRIPYLKVRWLRSDERLATLSGGVTYLALPDGDATAQRLSDAISGVLAQQDTYKNSMIEAGAAFRQSIVRPTTGENTGPLVTQGRPIIVAYLGDARREKGFHHLPALQSVIGRRHGSSVHCRIQSYITSLDTAILTAREQLRQ